MSVSEHYPKQILDFLNSLAKVGYDTPAPDKTELEYSRKRLAYWSNRVVELEKKLIAECHHAEVSIETYYDEGSYLNLASTTYTIKCEDCGLKLFTWVDQHSYYG